MTQKAAWYFDYVSPFAYLQLENFACLPDDLEVTLKPVLFAGLLGHWQTKGPAEVPAKRLQTYRYCQWLAGKRGVALKTPPRHPFNPLAVLRLTIALGSGQEVVRTVFRHIWGTGRDGQDPGSLKVLAASLGVDDLATCIADPAVKDELKRNTDEAIARGVFGIPTFALEDELFWGEDVTGMMLDYLQRPDLFRTGDFARLDDLPVAAQRKESRL